MSATKRATAQKKIAAMKNAAAKAAESKAAEPKNDAVVIVEILDKKIEVPMLPANVSEKTLDAEIENRAIIVWKAINPKQAEKVNGDFSAINPNTQTKIRAAVVHAFALNVPNVKNDAEAMADEIAENMKAKPQTQKEVADELKASREAKKAAKAAKEPKAKAEKAPLHPFFVAKQNAVNAYRTLVAARDKSATDADLVAKMKEARAQLEAAFAHINMAIDTKATLAEVRK